ncbi:MAG: rRNA pseudouridine synthase [Clostridia bacterium]|nr:rRNA pseudouridine synthase [Clostridia bacterium]
MEKKSEYTEKIRIQKYFTDCGILSRRAAESEILAGKVQVNGVPAGIGQKIDPSADVVTYLGKPIRPLPPADHVTVMLHKPAGFVTTANDDRGRPCVTELVSDLGVRVYPVGRLDMFSTGLLLLTNDGELANLLTHPRHHLPKVYHVAVGGEVSPTQLKRLSSPMTIDGYRLRPVKVNLLRGWEHKTELEMTLTEGRNRQIRKMCEQVGLRVLSLHRVALGPLVLGHLPEGRYRRLAPAEVAALKNLSRKPPAKEVEAPARVKIRVPKPSQSD